MARQAVRRSYKLEVDSDDEKFTIGAARNSIGKRVVKKMCEWFGCEKWRQLPEDLNITRNNHLFNIDGILRPYLEPETVRLLDVEDSEKFLGHRNYDEGSAPRRFEIGYTPPAASQKKKRSSIKKRTKLSADTAFHDDFADEDVKVQPMPQKKRRNGRSVAGNRKQELQPEHHEATTPHEAPGPAATMQAEHDDQIDPQLYDEGELRPISSASEHFPVDQQLTHAMADYSGSNAEGKLNGMIGPSQTSYEAMISNDHDNNIDNGNHASSPPMYPEMAPATHPPEFVESTIQPYGASRVPEPRMSYWSQLMPTYQTADGLGSPSITDTMAPANHFSDAELRSQRLIMQHYGPIRDASGMIVTNFAHYAMLVLQNGLHPGLF